MAGAEIEGSSNVDMEISGELFKRSDHLRRWNKRFFVLIGDHLRYYKKETDRYTRGNLHMAGVFVKQSQPRQIMVKGKPLFCFELGHPKSKQRIRVGARSLEDATAWEKHLRNASKMSDSNNTVDGIADLNSLNAGSIMNESDDEMQIEEDNLDGEGYLNSETKGDEGESAQNFTAQTPTKQLISTTDKSSPKDEVRQEAQQENKVQLSPIRLPKSNPIVDAGLSTNIVVASILIPVFVMHTTRILLPWWTNDDIESMQELIGNLMFIIALQSIIIFVMATRGRS